MAASDSKAETKVAIDQNRSYDSEESDRSRAHVVFDLIEDANWNAVMQHLREYPQSARCLHRNPNSVQCNLPLHEACRMQPPLHIVNKLIDIYDEAVLTPGQYGFLPLHVACGSGAGYDVVARLLDAYPAATRCRDDVKDALPLHLAAQWGASEEVLMEILTTHPEGSFIRDASGKTPLDHAKALPEGESREYAINALETAPILVATAKSAAERVEREMESRLRGIQDAHKEFIRQMEQRHEDEKTEFLRLEVEFHNELATEKERNCELAEVILTLQKRELRERNDRNALKKSMDAQRKDHQTKWEEQRAKLQTLMESVEDLSLLRNRDRSFGRKEGEEKEEALHGVRTVGSTVSIGSSSTASSSDELLEEVALVVSNYNASKAGLDKLSKELKHREDMVRHLNELLSKKDEEIRSLTSKLKDAERECLISKDQARKIDSLHTGTLQELNSAKNEMNRLRRRSETQLEQLNESKRMVQLHESRLGNIKSLVASLSYNIDSWTQDAEESQVISVGSKRGSSRSRSENIGDKGMAKFNPKKLSPTRAPVVVDGMDEIQSSSMASLDCDGDTERALWDQNRVGQSIQVSNTEDEDDENVGLEVTVTKIMRSSDKSIGGSGSHDTAVTAKNSEEEAVEDMSAISRGSDTAKVVESIRPIE